jgi:hypothetical protein
MRVSVFLHAQLGVATIASGVQRSGGSVRHPEQKLDEALEQMAAYIEVHLPVMLLR